MWIRSQDKKLLINVKAVTLERASKIYGWASGDCYFNIAEYDSKEKAMNVLDAIENVIGNENTFQMPE
ncbi:MAG: hypothetical protein PHY47_12670 [Lachnospiraceae bacterium]|nr:hypothetical protein [Lachnospiraceae bacterium]